MFYQISSCVAQKSPFLVGAIYCGIIAIHFPYIAIYRDTLLKYRDSPIKDIIFFSISYFLDLNLFNFLLFGS